MDTAARATLTQAERGRWSEVFNGETLAKDECIQEAAVAKDMVDG